MQDTKYRYTIQIQNTKPKQVGLGRWTARGGEGEIGVRKMGLLYFPFVASLVEKRSRVHCYLVYGMPT